MDNMNEEVPTFARIGLGHICGIVAVILTIFLVWSLCRFALTFEPRILLFSAPTALAIWFFARIAVSLLRNSYRKQLKTLIFRAMSIIATLALLLLVASFGKYALQYG